MGLLGGAGAWLAGQLAGAAGETVTYARGVAAVTLTAWPGQSLFAVSAPAGNARVIRGDADWCFRAADLGVLAVPQENDTISVTRAGVQFVFRVAVPVQGDPAFRFSDPQRTLVRVHTKLKTRAAV